MNDLSGYPKKLRHLCSSSWTTLTRLFNCCCCSWIMLTRLFASCCCQEVLSVSPFLIYTFYFVSLSFLGFGILKSLNPRTTRFTPRNLDLFFTSVSATSVSSMSTVEMEVFSNSQLIVLIVLMFLGGEVLVSMVGLYLRSLKIRTTWDASMVNVVSLQGDHPANDFDWIESQHDVLKHADCIKFLGFVGLCYLLVNHLVGICSVLFYLFHVQTAKDVLRTKGLDTFTFAIFTVVSTFTNCGFIPTNENMVVFRKNPGLLWILIPQILLGNTLFPSALSLVLWVSDKRFKKKEAKYLLQNVKEIGCIHFLPSLHSALLAVTVTGFVLIGFIMFCSMEWYSSALSGMNTYQKAVAALFQSVNARHAGETVVDLSTIAPAILVFFVFMMYLPPYASFLPIKGDESPALESEQRKKHRNRVVENLVFSQLTYLVISVTLICITERKSLKDDPINFSVLNITLEVISAYGNVGFTTGYSCKRQLRPDPSCVDKWYGFAGKWSDKGKVILIIVMLFGRMKKFSKNGGQAWKL